MSNGTSISVYFTCPCGLHYTATQAQVPEQNSGDFVCSDCGKTVHDWTGHFTYSDWKPVVMKPFRPGALL